MVIVAVDKSERCVDIRETDCHELCITDTHIFFYDSNSYFEDENAKPIGDLEGTLVNVASMDEDPYTVCDDISQDLGYVMQFALNDIKVCMFYISQFRMDDKDKGAEIIRNLPTVIFKLMGRRPDLLASYPDALPYELDEETKKHHDNLLLYQYARMNTFLSGNTDDAKKDIVLPYGPDYQFTKDDIDFLLGRGGGYPEQAINRDAFNFWESLGFTEVRNSRVLIYKVRKIR